MTPEFSLSHSLSVALRSSKAICIFSSSNVIMAFCKSGSRMNNTLFTFNYSETNADLYNLKSSSLSLNPLLRSILIPFSASAASFKSSVSSAAAAAAAVTLPGGAGSVGSAIGDSCAVPLEEKSRGRGEKEGGWRMEEARLAGGLATSSQRLGSG
ncbi:hypothetical protein EYF80_023532 [Liparis tanakae]|uniref:Uncharacterized protein n=1 Tax=Liparis tanakae TaxID=230148 RepID=A0A4Z2HKF6_9TELE|nr:hypothetical protein EYF80_023532 [Liparis tanakae]